jgi:hypothetical protein
MMKLLRRSAAALIAAAFLLPVSGCGGKPAEEEGPAGWTFMPQPAVVRGDFTLTLYVPQDGTLGAQREGAAHLQKLLNDRGWGIKLAIRTYVSDGQTEAPEAPRIEESAGDPSDGYVVSKKAAEQLLADGYTRDLAQALKDGAPALYSRYKTLFGESAAGIPLYVYRGTRARTTALVLQSDIAAGLASPIRNMSDVLDLVESGGARVAGYSGVIDAWAGEQGYYALDGFDIRGQFYAAYDDPDCTPVPVEKIPGFDSFFRRSYQDFQYRRLLTYAECYRENGEPADGYLGALDGSSYAEFLYYQIRTRKEYTAFPLEGCGMPPLRMEIPSYSNMAVVPKASGKAALVAKFFEWALTREGYDLVRYGEEGSDYRLEGEKLVYMEGGGDIPLKEMFYPEKSHYYTNLFLFFFYDSAMERGTAYVPSGYDDATDAANRLPPPPIWDILRPGYSPAGGARLMGDVESGFENIIEKRDDLLCYENIFESGGMSADERLTELSVMARDTDRLAAAYGERIRELREKSSS